MKLFRVESSESGPSHPGSGVEVFFVITCAGPICLRCLEATALHTRQMSTASISMRQLSQPRHNDRPLHVHSSHWLSLELDGVALLTIGSLSGEVDAASLFTQMCFGVLVVLCADGPDPANRNEGSDRDTAV